ncbi:unnamed protein product [Rangifer tarandus platyrhynchus]|uniref:Uncharacterized protein n=2 Tax=Rangifer tarandus platyrhynchus TaxID=3082113 RepID=A0ABN8YBL5_RANTA|nr:unnamed protein product [Rangifer tarandus platyrhynchus]
MLNLNARGGNGCKEQNGPRFTTIKEDSWNWVFLSPLNCVLNLYPTLLSRGACGLGQEEPSRAMNVERTTYTKRQTFHGLEGPQQSRPWSGPMVHPPSWRFFSHRADPEFSFGSAVHQCSVNVSSFFLLETVYFPSTYLHLKS